jgi:hypothetical protein
MKTRKLRKISVDLRHSGFLIYLKHLGYISFIPITRAIESAGKEESILDSGKVFIKKKEPA